MNANEELNVEVQELQSKLEKYSGASKKLRELGNLKGKISNKVSTITKEHKFLQKIRYAPLVHSRLKKTLE